MTRLRYLSSGGDVWAWAKELVTELNKFIGSSVQVMPAGAVTDYAGEEVPLGWLLCDGSSYSKKTYPSLYLALGYVYGGSGGNFNVPDYRGRITIGAGTLVDLAELKGSDSVTLSTAELPVHTHGVTDPTHTHAFTGAPHGHAVTDPGHVHAVTDPGHVHANGSSGFTAGAAAGATQGTGNTGSAVTGLTINSAATGLAVVDATATGTNEPVAAGISIDNAGGGTAFSVLNPVVGVRKIIKV